MDPLSDFHLVSLDLLKLIAFKKDQKQLREAEVLEKFYQNILSIATKSSEELHIRQLKIATEHYKAKILEFELKQAYNYVFKRDQKLALELIAISAMPTKKQLSEEVIIK